MLQNNRASGAAILDRPPSAPEEKIYSKPTQPGDDTLSLFGMPPSSMGGNPALSTPGGKLLLVVSMLMQASNIADSIMPGFIPEPMKQAIAAMMEQAPMLADQLSRQQDPAALLSAVGSSAAASPTGAPPMGMPAMGLGGGAGAGAGMPPMGAGGRMPQRPPM